MDRALRVAVWNVQWATARSRGGEVRKKLEAVQADVVIVTEGCAEVLPLGGYVATSTHDYGYSLVRGRRKVLIWSRQPWERVETHGSGSVPPGRFVAASTSTPVGVVRVLGVCIPWRDAHVNSGRRDRRAWEDHLAYLDALRAIVAEQDAGAVVIAGDFNQRLPRDRQPQHVFDALVRALGPHLLVATAGKVLGAGGALIDHVAHSASLAPSKVEAWSRLGGDGRELSDHDGVCVQLCRSGGS